MIHANGVILLIAIKLRLDRHTEPNPNAVRNKFLDRFGSAFQSPRSIELLPICHAGLDPASMFQSLLTPIRWIPGQARYDVKHSSCSLKFKPQLDPSTRRQGDKKMPKFLHQSHRT